MTWDGFPLDSTFSRGQIEDEAPGQTAYEARQFFEFKFANGLPILGIQVDEDEALHRTQTHVTAYHRELARLHVDHLVDCRTEIEVAGIQLLHLPFWHARYAYKPRTALRYFYKPKEKNVLLEGYGNGILHGELAIKHHDKVWINSVVCGLASLGCPILGFLVHPAFYLVAGFSLIVTAISFYLALQKKEEQALAERSNTLHTNVGEVAKAS